MNRIVILLLAAAACQLSAFGQGPLTPPGPPGPTMITLSQIEPRTPITNLPYTITAPGSYYLTTNLTCTACSNNLVGITIAAGQFFPLPPVENVTIDLNGFTLFGVAGSYDGIGAPIVGQNYVIRNGTLRNWGHDGVDAYSAFNSRFEDLRFDANGHMGLEAGLGSVVANCVAYSNVVAGIFLVGGEISHCVADYNLTGIGILVSNGCAVADCTAIGNGGDGINGGFGALVRSCTAYANGGNGITTSDDSTVKDCTVCTNGNDGIVAGNNCAVIDCTVSANENLGISVPNNCTVKDCTVSVNALYGIYITGVQNRIDGNSVNANVLYGLHPNTGNVGNCIVRNSAHGNGFNYGLYTGNNDYAPTGTVNTATNPWTNF